MKINNSIPDDFLAYWESLGFFGYASSILPQKFMQLFDIARIIETNEIGAEFNQAMSEMCDESKDIDIEKERFINRIEISVPLGDRMELDRFRNIFDLKKALPRELASDEDIFEVKLFTKTLMVQRYYESDEDKFRFINKSRTGDKDSNKFEQKFYLLLDRSRSMDKKMRFFYAKCMVSELLRRKLGTGARLYYRSFDSATGPLVRITDRNDFNEIIREILLTDTGGSRTDIQGAILQAVDDINFDSDMMHSEILMVTDGLSTIDKEVLKSRLGPIKLNIVRIGDDKADPPISVVEKMLKQENIDINSFDQDMGKVREIGKQTAEFNPVAKFERLSQKDVIINRMVQKYHLNIDRDLKDISFRFFDIKDFDMSLLYKITEQQEEEISRAVIEIEESFNKVIIQEDKVILYKKVHFLSQYITMLIEGSTQYNSTLKALLERLYLVKVSILNDYEVFAIVSEIPELQEDPKFMKNLGREAKEKMKIVSSQKKRLNSIKKKMFKMTRGGDSGQDIPGGLLVLLIMILIENIKKIATYPFRKKIIRA